MKVVSRLPVLFAMLMIGQMCLIGCERGQKTEGVMGASGFPQTTKSIVIDPSNPPRDDAKVIETYQDNLFGKTELRDDDYHRHVDTSSPTGWTPWHYRRAPHRWGDEPAPAKTAAPAPAPARGTVTSWVAYPTGDKATSALLIERTAPAQVSVGQGFEYLIRVTNLTNTDLYNINVTETLPEAFKFESADPAQSSLSGRNIAWAMGDFGPRESQLIKVKGAATKVGTLQDCVAGTYSQKACLEVAVVQPALTLTKTAPAEVLLCEPIPIKLVVTNTGSGPATNVSIKDELPKGLVTADGKSTVVANAGTLAAGESKAFTITLKAQEKGKYLNKATATGDGNLTADASTTTVVLEPVLKISKTGPDKLFLGRDATYKITVSNTGDGIARDTVVEDVVSGGSIVNASTGGTIAGNRVVWNLGALNPKDTRELTLTVRSTQVGEITDSVTAKASCAAPVSASAKTAMAGIPAILLEVVDIQDPVRMSESVTYVITATNQGTAVGTNIKINCTLEDTMQFVSAEGATAGKSDGKLAVNFAPLPSLAPKASATWKVTVKAVKAGDVRFKTTMNSDQLTRDVEETEATNFFE